MAGKEGERRETFQARKNCVCGLSFSPSYSVPLFLLSFKPWLTRGVRQRAISLFCLPSPAERRMKKGRLSLPSILFLLLYYSSSTMRVSLGIFWNGIGKMRLGSPSSLYVHLSSLSHTSFFSWKWRPWVQAGYFIFIKKGLLGPELCNGFPLSFKTRKKWQDRNCAHELWSQLRIPCIFYTSYLRSFGTCRAGLTASCSRKNKTEMIVLIKVMVFVRLPSVSVPSHSAWCICTPQVIPNARKLTCPLAQVLTGCMRCIWCG